MKIPLSKEEYEVFEKLAEEHGLTVDQEVQLALLYYFKCHNMTLYEQAKKYVDPKVLEVLERS